MAVLSAARFMLSLSAAFLFSGSVFVSCHLHLDVFFPRQVLQQFFNRASMFLFCNVIILLITMDSGLLGFFAPPHPPPVSSSGLRRSKRDDDDGVEKSGGEFNLASQKMRDIESIGKAPDRRCSKRDDESPTVPAVVVSKNSSEFSCAAQKMQHRRSSTEDPESIGKDASAAFAVVVTKGSSQFIRTAEIQDRRSSKRGTVAPAAEVIELRVYEAAPEERIKDGLENSAGCLDLVAVRGVNEKAREEQIIHPLMEEEEEEMDNDDLKKKIEEFIENFKSQRRKEALQLVMVSSN